MKDHITHSHWYTDTKLQKQKSHPVTGFTELKVEDWGKAGRISLAAQVMNRVALGEDEKF